MATLKQLLATQKKVEVAAKKLGDLKTQRSKEVIEVGLKEPNQWGDRREENLVSIDGVPHRIWVYRDRSLEIEELTFD